MPTIEELQTRIAELEAEVARLKVQPLPPEAAHLVNAQRRMAEAEMRYNMLAKERLGMEERIAELENRFEDYESMARMRWNQRKGNALFPGGGLAAYDTLLAEAAADERRKTEEEIATWLEELVAYLKETYTLWDSDKDMKVGKRLKWLTGSLPGYEPDKLSPFALLALAKLRTQAPDAADLYYVQYTKTYVGNDVSWWAKDHFGYTTDLSQAKVFTRAEIERLDRDCDVAWPKAYIDVRTRPAVDIQRLEPDQAITREKRVELRHG